MDALLHALGEDGFRVVAPLLKILVVVSAVMGLITYLVYIERRVLGYMQARRGPNRVGPYGLLQPIADVVKLLVKEDVVPREAVKWAFLLAPGIVVVPALVIFSVIPFGPPGSRPETSWAVTDLNVGLLFVVALATIGVYGIIIGGWASNSKFSLLGGLRSAAQMISYEVPQALALVGVLMSAGTMSLVGIVQAQQAQGIWFFFPQILGFFVYFVAGVAESNRNPFDLPEAESELVAGFHTEYSGMRWALFFLGEYANMIVISAVAVTLFFGGWLQPFPNVAALSFLAVVPGVVWFAIKLSLFLFAYIWFRGTFPRYRFDQLMDLGWKWMIPLALFNLVVTGALRLAF